MVMTIDKAIEILTQTSKEPNIRLDNDEIDAIRLGNEALKFVTIIREGSEGKFPSLLPGETEE